MSTIQCHMKLVMNVALNALPHEEKHKILYNNNENAVLYNEYIVKIV